MTGTLQACLPALVAEGAQFDDMIAGAVHDVRGCTEALQFREAEIAAEIDLRVTGVRYPTPATARWIATMDPGSTVSLPPGQIEFGWHPLSMTYDSD